MVKAPIAYPEPIIGDVVRCRFPHQLVSGETPKPRPVIVLRVRDPAAPGGPYQVDVCSGTSQVKTLYPHEFEVTRTQHPAEYRQMGLSYDTKFDMRRIVTLEYTSEWFEPLVAPRFGKTPKLGSMPAATVPRMKAAYKAAQRR